MRAAVLTGLNQPLEIRDVKPLELQFGQVLVKVLVSGICGAQLQEIRGDKGNEAFLPHLLGHEGCGVVEKVGPGVSKVRVGDKVVMHWRVGAGIESDFPSYSLDGKVIRSGKVTTLSEKSIVSENRLTAVPADTPPHLAALLGCGLSTALGVVNNDAHVKIGESVAVLGAGGVGLSLTLAASLASANPIVAFEISESKREMATTVGATHFVNTSNANPEELEQIVENGRFDVVLDTTGSPQLIGEFVEKLSENGRFIMVGQPRPGQQVSFTGDSSFFGSRGKRIQSSQGGQTSPSDDIPRYVRLAQAGRLPFEQLVTHSYHLDEINNAFDDLRAGRVGRALVEFEPEEV